MTKIKKMPARKTGVDFCHRQSGQTLIETLVAVFMLVMGISAAVGLAIYALSQSTNITKQIVAAGLAREGLEAVKEMRDTNWLQQGSANISTSCYNYTDGSATAACYSGWLNKLYCLDPNDTTGSACNGTNNAQNFSLSFSPSSANFWVLQKQTGGGNYGLTLNTSSSTAAAIYDTNGNISCANGSGVSDFCRKIVITKIYSAPYNQNEGPLVRVQSQVWWVDKKCPRAADYSQANSACQVEMDMYLTNWKNY